MGTLSDLLKAHQANQAAIERLYKEETELEAAIRQVVYEANQCQPTDEMRSVVFDVASQQLVTVTASPGQCLTAGDLEIGWIPIIGAAAGAGKEGSDD